jgi:hypothetical protein
MDWVAQLKKMLEKWALEIQPRGRGWKSIHLACLAIGCYHMLVFGKLQDNSEPHDKPDLSPILAHWILYQSKDLVAQIMDPVRSVHELNAKTRPGVVLLYLYLSMLLLPKLKAMRRCQLWVSCIIPHILSVVSSTP